MKNKLKMAKKYSITQLELGKVASSRTQVRGLLEDYMGRFYMRRSIQMRILERKPTKKLRLLISLAHSHKPTTWIWIQ